MYTKDQTQVNPKHQPEITQPPNGYEHSHGQPYPPAGNSNYPPMPAHVANPYYPLSRSQPPYAGQTVIVQQPATGGFLGGLGDMLDPRPFAGSGVNPIVSLSGPQHSQIQLIPYPSIPGVSAGLEPLVEMDAVIIKQKVELLEVFAGIETANKYNVLNGQGQRVYYAGETTNTASLCFGGPQRPFEITIVDFHGRTIMTLKRPCDWKLYLSSCCCCLGVIGGECEIRLYDGTPLGKVRHVFNCYQINYEVTDGTGKDILTIGGMTCGDCCCCMQCCEACTTREFPVKLMDGTELGKIRKKFSGLQEFFTDADTFGLSFPKDLDVRWKAIMLGAVFLIDFMYFESPPSDRRHH